MNKKAFFSILVVLGLVLSAVPAVADSHSGVDIVDVAVDDGRFTTLVAAVQAAGLVDTLKSDGPFTVFAPTDNAFEALPEGLVAALLHDIPALTEILTYHVVAGQVMAADVVNLTEAATVFGENVDIRVEDGKVYVDNAQVIITDVMASNGVIHVIDSVLVPDKNAGEGDYLVQPGDTLYGIAHEQLGDGHRYLEIVELTNERYASDMSYAMIENPNLLRINWKLAIPQGASTSDIVDVAVADGRFTTLVAAVQAADLVDTLKGEGPFTVFAPTDAAFAKLPEGTVEGLLEDIPTLTDILLYHVVAGKVMAADLVELASADTVLGKPVTIEVMDGKVMINEAQVIITDVPASNGVIHVIDSVILPPSE